LKKISSRARTDGRDDDLVGNPKAAGGGFVKVFGLNIFEALALERWQNISFKTRRA